MIIIYPEDPTTTFLSPIITGISEKTKAKIAFPPLKTLKSDEISDFIVKADSLKTILYLGHGTSSEIMFFRDMEGFVDSADAAIIFKDRKLIFLSCYSSIFLQSFSNQFRVGIGFGNIFTDESEVIEPQDQAKYGYDSYKCISVFRERLITLFKNSIVEAHLSNCSFLEFYHLLKLRINKTICSCSLSKDKTEHLVGELMYKLKKEMVLIGNATASMN